MSKPLHDPARDGFTHINVYTKGKTELGRKLTNPAKAYFSFPKSGEFQSVEGFWFWLRCALLGHNWTGEEKQAIHHLRTLHGLTAKKEGSAILEGVPKSAWANFPEERFRAGVKEAIRQKIINDVSLQKDLVNSSLPFAHYYWYGKEDDPAIREAGHAWVIEALEEFRLDLKVQASKTIVYRLHIADDILVMCDSTEDRLENIGRILGLLDERDAMSMERSLNAFPCIKPALEEDKYREWIKSLLWQEGPENAHTPRAFVKVVVLEETGFVLEQKE